MSQILSERINKLEKGFEDIERETPCLRGVVKAFREVFISRAALKARLSDPLDNLIPPPDSVKIAAGQPWLTEAMITSFVEPWGENARFALQPLLAAFPSIRSEILRLIEALDRGSIYLERCVSALVEGREDDIVAIAAGLDMQPLTLKFIVGQILKPFVEKRTESLRHAVSGLPWQEGFCPICGAFPELSFLQGAAGQRWLKCSLCGYDWRFDRMTCPYCGEKDAPREMICVDGFKHRWVETCSNCHRYIAGIDLRQNKGIAIDVAAIGMVHLDIIAQQRGYFPAAECAWNLVYPKN